MRPITTFVRALTAAEEQQLRAGLRSADAFPRRRCQILLASAAGQSPARIARHLGCTAPSVRNAFHAFRGEGLACLKAKSSRPKSARPLRDRAVDEPLRELLHRRPRALGRHRSTWTLGLVAQVCCQKGWTPRVLSNESMRLAVKRLGVSWRRAKHWIPSPDPAYARTKKPATA